MWSDLISSVLVTLQLEVTVVLFSCGQSSIILYKCWQRAISSFVKFGALISSIAIPVLAVIGDILEHFSVSLVRRAQFRVIEEAP